MQFDIETGKSVGWRLSTSGDAYGDGAHTLSDFLPVCETEVVIDVAQAFEYRNSRYLSLAFYTDEQRFISRPVMEFFTWPEMELHVPVPENAAYVRMSCPTSEYGTTVTLWHAGGAAL